MGIETTINTYLQASVTPGGATGYSCVHLINSLGVTVSGKDADATVLSGTWSASRQTIQSASYSGNGFFDYYGDTTGQKYLMDNAINGGETWFKYNFGSGTTYIKSRVELTNFAIKATTAGMIEFSFAADSTGTITMGSD